jgi:RimJ/RimL family protein N-acetyltransferase
MTAERLWAVEARRGDQVLLAIEPTPREIARAAPRLAAYYNDAHNRRMLAHEADLSPDEVVAYYEELRRDGGRPFLLIGDGALVGDGDLRNVEAGAAELAILIGARAQQGRGLGTSFAAMLNVFAFQVLALRRLYVSIIPANASSQRLFEKLGYQADNSPDARAYIDEETDLTLSVDRPRFEAAAGPRLPDIRAYPRALDPSESAGPAEPADLW